MRPLGWSWGAGGADDIDLLPFGAVVATCELIDCRPTDSFTQKELDTVRYPEGNHQHSFCWTERQMGNFDLGRFGWVLDNIKALPEPIPWRGSQGLFEVSLDLAA